MSSDKKFELVRYIDSQIDKALERDEFQLQLKGPGGEFAAGITQLNSEVIDMLHDAGFQASIERDYASSNPNSTLLFLSLDETL